MADPLTVLRRYIVSKREIIERDDQVVLGDLSWPKNIKTNYRIHRSKKTGAQKDYYTLESIIFLLRNVHLSHPEYAQKAAESNIQAVRRPDKKNLLAFLNGEIAFSVNIDKSEPLPNPKDVN